MRLPPTPDSLDAWRVPLAVLLALLAFSAPQPGTAAPRDIRFGAVEAYHAPNAAWEAGVAWERVRFHWAQIQVAGQDSWNDGEFTDSVLENELAAGRQVVGLLIGLPDWANENGIPRGLHLPHTDPGNTWATYVRRVVSRYAGRIDHWILWNEPDVWDSSHPGHTWGGSVEDFLQLTRVGYVTAKETNPNAVVLLSAFTHWWDAAYGRPLYFQRFLEALTADPNAAGNNYYFDAATLHLYFQPHFVFDITSFYYGLMGSFGFWKPIWIVETNAAPSMDPSWPVGDPRFHVSLEEQAAYMPQALALGMAAGAQRLGVYKLIDTPGDAAANPEPFGLVRADGSRRPAFTTFQVATTMLAGASRVSRDRWDDVGQVTVTHLDDSKTAVLFSRAPGPRTAQVPADLSETGTLVDMWGNRQTVYAQDGVYAINLPAAPCSQMAGTYCMIGGPTFYLVQGAVPAQPPAPVVPAATAPPSPTPSGTSTSSPTETPSPDPTPTPVPTLEPTPTETASPSPSPSSSATRPPATDTPSATATASATPLETESPLPQPPADREVASQLPLALVVGAAVLLAGLVVVGILLRQR